MAAPHFFEAVPQPQEGGHEQLSPQPHTGPQQHSPGLGLAAPLQPHEALEQFGHEQVLSVEVFVIAFSFATRGVREG